GSILGVERFARAALIPVDDAEVLFEVQLPLQRRRVVDHREAGARLDQQQHRAGPGGPAHQRPLRRPSEVEAVEGVDLVVVTIVVHRAAPSRRCTPPIWRTKSGPKAAAGVNAPASGRSTRACAASTIASAAKAYPSPSSSSDVTPPASSAACAQTRLRNGG